MFSTISLYVYRVIKKFLRSSTVFVSNVNIVCLGTAAEKLFDHSVLSVCTMYAICCSVDVLVFKQSIIIFTLVKTT
jgi:hypothetical protein